MAEIHIKQNRTTGRRLSHLIIKDDLRVNLSNKEAQRLVDKLEEWTTVHDLSDDKVLANKYVF